MKVYLDSSSFAKRFIDEVGSDKVEEVCMEATELGLSILCVPEVISALKRRQRERSLTQGQYHIIKSRLIEDVSDADVIHLTPSVINSSISILELNPIRTLDALHVASALAWSADLFVSSDKRQLDAAKQVGLRIKKV